MDNKKNDNKKNVTGMDKENIDKIINNLDKEKKSNKIYWLMNYISITVALIGLIISFPFFFNDLLFKKPSKINLPENISNITTINDRILGLEKLYNQISLKLDSVMIINKDSVKQTNFNNVEFYQLKYQVTELNASVKNLESVILDNPEKAISLLLLKQQLENQRDQNEKEYKNTKDEIARVYDINKWIIGLVIAMLVSIITLSIGNLLSKNKKE